ncbi:hypothetical protein TspCOW1_08130 [Thiohalobacter sp. COW1]|uniref:Anthranilate synthase component I n=1 Tax=Thiohalobacter thiocyanaticus TaxID=585455 RepID=A0A1Z4VRX0_9GAMM|nr:MULTISPECIES: aminodeoxychorismate synthase component I [Thiohalobacter]BAZ94225.1 anthranilate synthase component I [Thiohalobacter thiocyanaticus]BCO30710.1 hypothetical protein TspCOW1_08130 [Thiohalobacter sp. COW1]
MTVAQSLSSATLPAGFDLLALHEAFPERYPFLLESALSGTQGRYDILFAFPGETLTLQAPGQLQGPAAESASGFLPALDAWWREAGGRDDTAGLPFNGGWFLLLGYELAQEVEPVLQLSRAPHMPFIATAVRCPAAVIADRRDGSLQLVSESDPGLVRVMREDIEQAAARPPPAAVPLTLSGQTEEAPQHYLDAVERTLGYIRDGDVFQVNLSRLWTAELGQPVTPAALYRRLRDRNPGPFNGLAVFPDYAVISSSPERLVEVRGRRVSTRPIAGTRPRGQGEQDRELSDELLGHPKERAEHIMLIDLERNDLGRVCRPGSIEVDELMQLESYAHVHHIVSNIQGELRPEITPGEVIRAVYPGGTITGCPKVRCMQIIAELEAGGRGAYTGAMGYLNRNGDMDLNILIRTIEQRDRRLYWRAGAGIVSDSRPQQELEETRAKARGLVLALENTPEDAA